MEEHRFSAGAFVRLDNSAIYGHRLVVYGSNNTIQASLSVIHGDRNRITGNSVTVIGHHNTINGYRATVTGDTNTINGNYAYATGDHCVVTGSRAHVIGNENRIRGDFAKLAGNGLNVNGDNAEAYGHNNLIVGRSAKVEGNFNTVTGSGSRIIGTANRVRDRSTGNEEGWHNRIARRAERLSDYLRATTEALRNCNAARKELNNRFDAQRQDRAEQRMLDFYGYNGQQYMPDDVGDIRSVRLFERTETNPNPVGPRQVKLTLRGEDEELDDGDSETDRCLFCRVKKANVAGLCCGKLVLCLACTRNLYSEALVGEKKCLNCYTGVEHCLRIS